VGGSSALRGIARGDGMDRGGSLARSRGERAARHSVSAAAHRRRAHAARAFRAVAQGRAGSEDALIGEPSLGLAGVVVLLVLLLTGMPIGIALGITGLGGLILTLGLEPALIKSGVLVFETMSRYELGTLPLFMLMAHLCFIAGASGDFFGFASRLFGHRRGGLAIAAVAGCAGFGSINGSSLATAATMGLVAVPEMRARGYSDALATGTVAAGGTLGQMIPPSGALIVFGIIAEQS